MPLLVTAFILAATGWTALSLYLSARQVAHVLQHRDRIPPDFAASVAIEDHRRAADYTVACERLARIETVLEWALSLAWALGGIGLLYGLLASAVPPSLTLGVLFLLATAVVSIVAQLPLDIYKTFVLEQKFGFNRTDARTFIADRLKGWAISLAVFVPLVFAGLWIMRSFAGLWWLWAWFGLVAIMIAAPAVYVRLIAPRFNTFTPLEDGALRLSIERLLARCGFRASGLFSMDASRRTAHGNAYFIGFGKAKRIVLFDTLIGHSTPEEIEAVVAHELGHFHYRHVWYAILRGAAILFAGLAAFGWLTKQEWLLPSFGIDYRDDALALFTCMLLASVIGPLIAPASNWISRKNEFQADDYARRHVGVGPMVSVLIKLARDNASTLTPDPIYALVNYSHPPAPVRVRQLREAGARDAGATPEAAIA
ncbi:M48 family metallopeptidase [Methylocapsa aurea]|uniref:M48 family metallopeptidase n=1 Tax=Methylocapsa aurea TaxID=663610 RepID=UPI0006900D12|nr:M48 family metallopeptidase [Methylocapsa aurea]